MNEIPRFKEMSRQGLLTLYDGADSSNFAVVEVLSPGGDLITAASQFFQALHRLDAAGLDQILAVRFPEQGLGRALNDRLQRAATSRDFNLGPLTSASDPL